MAQQVPQYGGGMASTGGYGTTQQPVQGQFGGQQGMGFGDQQARGRFEDSITGEMRVALDDFEKAAAVCGWCADRCIDEGPEMAECIRLCRDVEDLGSLNAQFLARDSIFGPELAETFARAAQECAEECARHPHEHCQECARVLNRAVDSTWTMLNSLQGQAGGMQQQQSGGAQQPQSGGMQGAQVGGFQQPQYGQMGQTGQFQQP